MLYIWKFIISTREWVTDPDDPNLQWKGCVASAIAETAEQAKIHLERFAAMNGVDSRWLRAAKVVQLPVAEGTVVSWSQE